MALSWALNTSPGLPEYADESVTVEVFGERFEWAADRDRVRVVGNARAVYPDVVISADTLWLDTNESVAAAAGDVEVTSEGDVLRGDEFVYCSDTGTAFLSNASAEMTTQTPRGEMRAYFSGRELRHDREADYVIDGSFTTCDTHKPHYRIEAKEWKRNSDGSFTAKGARIVLYHMRLPRLPRLRISMGAEDDDTSLAPGFGISSRDGFYVSTSMDLTGKGSRPKLKAEGRLSARELFRGRIYGAFVDDERRSVDAVIGLNEDVRDELTRNLVVDRLPELRAAGEWSLDGGDRSAWYADAAVGNYRESPGLSEAWRESVQLGARHAFPLGRDARATVDLSFRQSFYSSGGSLGVTTAQLGASGMIGRRFRGGVRYIGRFGNGASPFEFDDIDIQEELYTGLRWSFGKWGIGTQTRYDIGRGEFRRAKLRMSRTVHCIQYGVSYDTVLREVGLRVTLPGM
ncbi:MAG: hypothetical protein ACE5JM_06265 [Armatimonadota bacterium]